jgi:hypothetical protein
MRNTSKTMAILLAVAVSAIAARAQDDNTNTPPGGFHGPRGHRPPAPLIVRALDANHDGVIDADEIADASAVLKTLDLNGDGKLTWDEYMGRPPGSPTNAPAGPPPEAGGAPDENTNTPPSGPHGPGGHHHPLPAIIRALDANHDGVIDADEIANASAALKTLDKNGDGQLTPDEFMGHPPKGGPRPGSPNGSDAGGPPPGDQGPGPDGMAGPDAGGPGGDDAPPQDPPQ